MKLCILLIGLLVMATSASAQSRPGCTFNHTSGAWECQDLGPYRGSDRENLLRREEREQYQEERKRERRERRDRERWCRWHPGSC